MSTNFDWTTGPLAEGLHCYRTQQFFEAHEHWEAVWLTLVEPEKSFLQALVQISAAFHHLCRGNRIGAMSLLTRSLRTLDQSPLQFCGVDVAKIRHEARNWLTSLQQGNELPTAYPAFEILAHNRAL
jgi:predicted metal-dependent hydrolase